MPIIAVMTGEGQKEQSTSAIREAGEAKIATEAQGNGSPEACVDKSLSVNQGCSKERTPTTFEVGFGC